MGRIKLGKKLMLLLLWLRFLRFDLQVRLSEVKFAVIVDFEHFQLLDFVEFLWETPTRIFQTVIDFFGIFFLFLIEFVFDLRHCFGLHILLDGCKIRAKNPQKFVKQVSFLIVPFFVHCVRTLLKRGRRCVPFFYQFIFLSLFSYKLISLTGR